MTLASGWVHKRIQYRHLLALVGGLRSVGLVEGQSPGLAIPQVCTVDRRKRQQPLSSVWVHKRKQAEGT